MSIILDYCAEHLVGEMSIVAFVSSIGVAEQYFLQQWLALKLADALMVWEFPSASSYTGVCG